MRIGSLFSGYGGLDMGVQQVLAGALAWHAEIAPEPAAILAHHHPAVPNLGDITAVDWSAVEPVEVLTGGFPCQDVSGAGKRAGMRPDTRSGLWSHFAYAIDRLQPRAVVIENVRGLLSAPAHHPAHGDLELCPWCVGDPGQPPLRALGAVLGELADLGYDASWHGLRASDVGAPHGRFRIFVVAWPAAHTGGPAGDAPRQPVARDRPPAHVRRRSAQPRGRHRPAAHAHGDGLEGVGRVDPGERDADRRGGAHVAWGPYESAVRRWEQLTRPAPAPTDTGRSRLSPAFVEWMMGLPAGWVTGVPGLDRFDQLRALGNGVVPQQAAAALRILLPDADLIPQETAA